ncbi:GNAT family N-acetyltransferase [Lichenicoccus sp.]|uniref:GNAT family N-acetyltransferase n=1 Tax=Lichenicoccus sp. TaxID=2781899 RepID=UPI003D12AC04
MTNIPFIHLRKELRGDEWRPVWPIGIRPALFEAGQHIEQAHNLLVEAYKYGGGHVGPVDEWWSALRQDPEYDPSVFFLAIDENDQVAGLAQCWTSAFLKDLAVAERWRRRGIGEALVLQAFTSFQARGAEHFDLKVVVDNPTGAARLYQRLGMKLAT